jgi:VWFA-related protein
MLSVCLFVSLHAQQEPPLQERDRDVPFRSGIELIHVSATVSDGEGRFVRGLRREDFAVYEDERRQIVTHFSSERVPISLGIIIDTSGSMAGERIRAAQDALDRFVDSNVFAQEDEAFLYRFNDRPALVLGWTTDGALLRRALGQIVAEGMTALYDAVAQAARLVATGRHSKKALVVLSDGRDTSSGTKRRDLKKTIVESDALLYAIGLECGRGSDWRSSLRPQLQRRGPIPIPIPFPPGGRGGWGVPPQPFPTPQRPRSRTWNGGCSDAVDRGALRDMTDDSGGRTEVVRSPNDLEVVTAGIADELRQQYSLGYISDGRKDGRWHAIRVEVRNTHYQIRSRRGYLAR